MEAIQKLNADRIRLEVDVDAPVVLVPESSTSTHVLKVWLGHLTVRNGFSRHGDVVNPGTGAPCVLDTMKVQLTDVFVAR